MGAANLAGAFFHAFPAGGGTSQTAVSSRVGARTQLFALVNVGIVAACTALLARGNLEAKLRESGTDLWLAALNPEALRVIRRSPLGPILGRDRMSITLEEAVKKYEERLSHDTKRSTDPG